MQKMKKTVSFFLCVSVAFVLQAQKFDWATTINGYDASMNSTGNEIVGAMTDSAGNLYICSNYGWGASLCGVNLPDAANDFNMVVAKISPNGELIWHKEAYGYEAGAYANSLVSLGDTAMMVCFGLYGPGSGFNEWLDVFGTRYGTQYNDFRDFFKNEDTLQFGNTAVMNLATFNLDGEITEMHHIGRTFLDVDGNPINVYSMIPGYENKIHLDESFGPDAITVDNEGSVIITRRSEVERVSVMCDTCSTSYYRREVSTRDGSISGMRYYVDGREIYDFMVPFSVEQWNVQMIKFAPKLDSVVFCRYLAYDTVGQGMATSKEFEMWFTQHLDCDNEGKIYLCGTVESFILDSCIGRHAEWDSVEQCYYMVNEYDTNAYCDILLDTLRPDLRVQIHFGQKDMGYLLKYAPDGTLLWLHQPQFEYFYRAHTQDPLGGCLHYSLQYDSTDNSIYLLSYFISGYAFDTIHNVNTNFGPADTVQHRYKGAGFIHLSADDAAYLGSGCAPAPAGAETEGSLAVWKNHVVMQVRYYCQLMGIDTVYQHNCSGQTSTMAMVHFNNDGRLLGVEDFGNSDLSSRPGLCLLRDSVLYLTGAIASNAHLGPITINASSPKEYIIKYVDTSFMSPYVAPIVIDTVHDGISAASESASILVCPNPSCGPVTVTCHTNVVAAYLTDMMGRCEQVRLVPQGHTSNHTYTLDLAGRPAAIYLLTMVTADGRQHTMRLVKQ